MPLPAVLPALGAVSSVLSGLGGLFGGRRQPRIPTTTLNPFSGSGVGGIGGYYRPGTAGGGQGNLNLNFGEFDPLNQQFAGLAGQFGGMAGMQGLPPGVAQALQSLYGVSGVPDFGGFSSGGLPLYGMGAASQFMQGPGGLPGNIADPTLQGLQGLVDPALMQSFGGLGRGATAPGLASTAFGGAQAQAQAAAQGFPDVFNRTLAGMREQAAPFEQRQFQDLQQNLFGTGRLGTTGGGLQTEAFARGLGQADISRQLAAQGEARATQGQALGQAQGLAGIGTGLTSLDDQLLSNAFGRFGELTGTSANLAQSRFGNAMDLSNTQFGRFMGAGQFGLDVAGQQQGREQQDFLNRMGISESLFGRGQQLLGSETTLAGLPLTLQGTALGNMLQALGGSGQLQNMAMQPLQFGLSAEQAGANARIGSASNQVAAMNSPSAMLERFGPASALTQLGQTLMGNRSATDIFRDIFNRPATTTTYPGPSY